jgi:hypothetical protein
VHQSVSSLLDNDDKLKNKDGNTFHTDKEFDIKWGRNELLVEYPADAKIYEQDKRAGEIRINYTPK